MIKDAVFVEGKIEPGDIQQGNIGDCYFLSAISSLAENPNNIYSIFEGQDELNKQGIYKLMVNYCGEPTELVIDDFIPVYSDNPKKTVFSKSINHEVWVLLLEKAWAKLCGSYEKTESGHPHSVLNTFSIAPCFYYDLSHMNQEKE